MAGGMIGGWASLGAMRPKRFPAKDEGRAGMRDRPMERVQQAPKSVPYKSAGNLGRATANEE